LKKVLTTATEGEPQNNANRLSDIRCNHLGQANTFSYHGAGRAREHTPSHKPKEVYTPMISKILSGAFLAFLLIAVSARARPLPPQSQSGQQSEQGKQTVTGKVTNVETGGKAFSMEVNQGNNKRTMQFVLDKNTVVQGHVGAGTVATVEYTQNGGQFIALNISEASAPSQSPSQSQSPSPSQQ